MSGRAAAGRRAPPQARRQNGRAARRGEASRREKPGPDLQLARIAHLLNRRLTRKARADMSSSVVHNLVRPSTRKFPLSAQAPPNPGPGPPWDAESLPLCCPRFMSQFYPSVPSAKPGTIITSPHRPCARTYDSRGVGPPPPPSLLALTATCSGRG
eukprot:SAG31_NODE_3181_length_4582_cov_2.306268_2_plen_156_part_00